MSHLSNQEFLEYWTEYYLSQGIDFEEAIALAENEFDERD